MEFLSFYFRCLVILNIVHSTSVQKLLKLSKCSNFLSHSVRIALVIALNVSSFLLIAHADADYLAIIGVIFTSLALGISEVTLLSYSAQFNK